MDPKSQQRGQKSTPPRGSYVKTLESYMRSKKHLAGAVALSIAIASLSACATAATNEPVSAGNAAPPSSPEGEVTFLSAENLSGRWDPFNHTILGQDRLQRASYETLVQVDENGEFVPGLAIEWENTTPETWRFKLRENVLFHNGEEMTAEDVKASIEYVSNPEIAWSLAFPNRFTAEVIDKYTVDINTDSPFAPMLGLLSTGAAGVVAPASAIEDGSIDEQFIGTGPYEWVSYEGEDSGVKLTAFADYWGEQPFIKDYTFRYVGDSQTRLAALKSGQADIIDRVEPHQIAEIENDPNLEINRTDTVESKWLAFRAAKAPMDNATLRRAIAHAINVEEIVDVLLSGSGTVNTSYFSPAHHYHADSPTFPEYDPEKAKELLAEAGYPGGEGLRTLEVMVSVGFYPRTKEYGELIVQNLADVGIKAELTTLETARYNQGLFDPEMGDIYDHGWFLGSYDANSVMMSLFGNALVTSVEDDKVNAALAEQTSAFDPSERERIIQDELFPALDAAMLEFPMFTSELITGYSAKLRDFDVPPTSYHEIEHAYLAE